MPDDSGCEECGGIAEQYFRARIGDKQLRFCHRDCLVNYVKEAKKGGLIHGHNN